MSKDHVQEHIDLIAKHEEEFLAKRTPAERAADSIAAFVGSLPFVVLHLVVFGTWVIFNTMASGPIRPFDPPPFSLLGTCVAMEGIVLASLILMKQGRLSKRGDERDHLMLQILMLTEKEITALLGMDRQIAGKVGLQAVANDQVIQELSEHTSIDQVAVALQESLPTE